MRMARGVRGRHSRVGSRSHLDVEEVGAGAAGAADGRRREDDVTAPRHAQALDVKYRPGAAVAGGEYRRAGKVVVGRDAQAL